VNLSRPFPTLVSQGTASKGGLYFFVVLSLLHGLLSFVPLNLLAWGASRPSAPTPSP